MNNEQVHYAIRSVGPVDFDTCPGFVCCDNVAGEEIAKRHLHGALNAEFSVLTVQDVDHNLVDAWLDGCEAVTEFAGDIEVLRYRGR